MPYVEDRDGLDFGGNGPWKGYPVAIVARALPLWERIIGRRVSTLRPDSRFIETGWESLELVEMVIATEEEFSIAMPDADAERITTVGELITYLKDRC
jgi:acyl carrier protein